MVEAFKNDDSTLLAGFLAKIDINTCYGNYSLLSHAIRFQSSKCFYLLIERGVNVNNVCNNYVPPIMHAAKYGSLEMVKILVSKGANINYKYEGSYEPARGDTPESYAEKNNQFLIAEYLKSLIVN